MSAEVENLCGLKREDFQTTVNGKQTDLFILKNSQGNEVAVTNYGGAIVAIMMQTKMAIMLTSSRVMTTSRMLSIHQSLS